MFLFKSKQFDADRFESELKKLTTKISYHEKKLRRLTTQRQHYRKVLPMYFIAVYLVYFSYLYQMKLLRLPRNTVKLILAPIIFGALYYGLLTVYSYLIDNTSAYVDALKEQHAEKLSTLKEKTNFDKTKELLARFSDGEDLQALEQEADEVRRKKQEYIKMIQEGDKGKVLEDLQKQQNSNSGLYDHLLGALLGENELGPDKRYALICSNCFKHNGLAPPGKLDSEVRYVCPYCGEMNGEEHVPAGEDVSGSGSGSEAGEKDESAPL